MGELILKDGNRFPSLSFVIETARQINKDFFVFNEVVYSSPEKISSELDLLEPLCKIVSNLLKNDKRKMMQIIYRIDISENSLGQQLSGIGAQDAAMELSKIIIQREFLKVKIRLNS